MCSVQKICRCRKIDCRETWCAVERMKEQDWCRKQRAHLELYQEQMQSDIFKHSRFLVDKEERCVFAPYKPRRKQQRHFPKIHNKSQLHL